MEAQVNLVLRKFDITRLGSVQRENILTMKRELAQSRVYARDYELSETREEQVTNAKRTKLWLGRARRRILKASESNIFGAADVAQLSAQIDQITGDLK
ncbi:MAG TPA: hypothetical protein VHL10_07090 [Nitrososphaera sp.]|nr:hypothetical protein [Nitrososphaera sp.]